MEATRLLSAIPHNQALQVSCAVGLGAVLDRPSK